MATEPTELVSAATIKTALDKTGSGQDSAINLLPAVVTHFAETFCGRPLLGKNSKTEYFDGRGHSELLLPRYPVTSVSSIRQSTDVPRVYDATTLIDSDNYVLDADTGIVSRIDGGTFYAGAQAVQVLYSAGYFADGTYTIPKDLERACIMLASVLLEKGVAALYHVTGERIEEGGAVTGVRFEDLPPTAREIFNRYRDWKRAA